MEVKIWLNLQKEIEWKEVVETAADLSGATERNKSR